MENDQPDFGTRRPLQLLLTFLGGLMWATVSLSLLVIALRLLFHDGAMLLIWLNSFTLYLFVPAYLALLFSITARRWRLLGGAMLCVIAHIYWVAPDYASAKTDQEANDQTLKLFSANLLMINTNLDPIINEIERANPDLILLQEYTDLAQDELSRRGIFERYPHFVEHPKPHSFGTALLSRVPTSDLKLTWIENIAFSEVHVLWAGTSIRVVNVHTLPPSTSYNVTTWRRQLDYLVEEALHSQEEFVLMGDFNATQHSAFFSKLLAVGMRNAHQELGRGWATTFPNGRMLVPPIRLDHLFISKGLKVSQIAEGEGRGSDHRPLIALIHARH